MSTEHEHAGHHTDPTFYRSPAEAAAGRQPAVLRRPCGRAGVPGAGSRPLDHQVGQVEVVLVGVLAQPLKVELAQEGALGLGQRG